MNIEKSVGQETYHASLRCQQRSIPEIGLDLVQKFGVCRPVGQGAVSYSFDKASWRRVESYVGSWPLKTMDRLRRLYVVVSDSGALITAAYKS